MIDKDLLSKLLFAIFKCEKKFCKKRFLMVKVISLTMLYCEQNSIHYIFI